MKRLTIIICPRLRDWKTLTDVIQKMETSLPRISVGTLNHLLHFLGKVGKLDTMMKVTVVGQLIIEHA